MPACYFERTGLHDDLYMLTELLKIFTIVKRLHKPFYKENESGTQCTCLTGVLLSYFEDRNSLVCFSAFIKGVLKILYVRGLITSLTPK